MSVIGTTHKQPRVFAHDATELINLPGCIYAGIGGFDLISGQNAGTGFELHDEAEKCYRTINETTGGFGALISVTAVGPNGEIQEIEPCSCGEGTMYSVGDILTVVWEASDTYSTGTDSTGFVQVDQIAFSPWEYGCPFSPMENRILSIEEIDKQDNVLNYKQTLTSFKQKDIVAWKCTGEEGKETCGHETFNPGAALYVGANMDSIRVIMESGRETTFFNVPAGSFLPISVLTVCNATPTTEGIDPKEVILALF
tara:strand:+ start:56 stop:820 length:765 start_codon:yes stop_codon:yes gene_type:complete